MKTKTKVKPYELLTFEDREAWLESRKNKITGTRLKDLINLRGTGRKKEFWNLVVEGLGIESDGENPMERGLRLENEAIDAFEEATGKKVIRGLTLCVSTENDKMAYSSDGIISETQDVEVKCLNSASHIEALVEGGIPDEYRFQILQGFIVNPKLQKRYFIFYDPRVQIKPFFFFEITRESKSNDIEFFAKEEARILEEVNELVLKLSNF